MSNSQNRRVFHPETPPWIFRAIVVGLVAWWCSLAVVSMLSSLRTVLLTIAVSFILACALEVPVNAMVRASIKRSVAALTMIFLIVATLVGLATAVGTLIAGQVAHLVHTAPNTLHALIVTLNHWFSLHLNANKIVERAHHVHWSTLMQQRGSSLHSTLSALGQLPTALMSLLLTYYLVTDGPKLRRHLCSMLTPTSQAELLRAWDLAIEKTGGYVISRLTLTAIRVVVAGVAFALCGIPAWLALAIWFGVVAEFVPIIGTFLASAVPVVVTLSHSPSTALVVLIFLVVFTQIRNLILAPKLTRRSVDVHPALSFLAVIAIAKVVGPAGALLAIPTVATVQAFSSSYIHRHELIEPTITPVEKKKHPR